MNSITPTYKIFIMTLIKFETDQLARAKGFDPLTSELWVEAPDGSKETMSDWEISKGKWDKDYYKDLGIYASTQSELQKWLRDVHGIDFISMCGGGSNAIKKWYKFTLPSCYTPSLIGGKTVTSSTYEEALEQVLIEALKLLGK